MIYYNLKLNKYILIDDIDHVNKLMFEFGRNETILNYYDINILSEIGNQLV